MYHSGKSFWKISTGVAFKKWSKTYCRDEGIYFLKAAWLWFLFIGLKIPSSPQAFIQILNLINPKFFILDSYTTPPHHQHSGENPPAATSQFTAGNGIINTFPFGFNWNLLPWHLKCSGALGGADEHRWNGNRYCNLHMTRRHARLWASTLDRSAPISGRQIQFNLLSAHPSGLR